MTITKPILRQILSNNQKIRGDQNAKEKPIQRTERQQNYNQQRTCN